MNLPIDINNNMNKKTGIATMASSMQSADNYNSWILQLFEPYIGLNILEVGTGYGNFKRLLPLSAQYISIDIDQQVITEAIKRDPIGIYVVADISSELRREQLSKYTIDTILCVNVLEHIHDDKGAINNMLHLLSTNGHLLLFIPAFQSLFSNMDELAGHNKRYSRRDVQLLFSDLSNISQIMKFEYFNPVGGIGWILNKYMHHTNLDSNQINMQVKLFDKYILPISKYMNKITKSFFGQSIICVVRKI